MDHQLDTGFAGTRKPLFWLALRTSVLTVLTLGFYRFWMKTRLRRWYWSSIRPGGIPLEYTGTPLEKLLGFLIAVVFLSFYIGVVNLILMFLSFSLLSTSVAAYVLSFIGVVPLIFYAQYRARRFLLARTRWRGIRFALEPDAWRYTGAAIGNWLLTILSLGILWPRMVFKLEKFRTDRTSFGHLRLEQVGRWQALWPAMTHLYIGVAITVAGGLVSAFANEEGGIVMVLLGLVWALVGFIIYKVRSFRILTGGKRIAGGDTRLVSQARTGQIIKIYVLGYFLTWLVLLVGLVAVFFLLGAVIGAALGSSFDLENLDQLPLWLTTALGMMTYFAFFTLWGVLGHVFVSMPLIRHYAETLKISGPMALNHAQQLERDEFAEAEGFAEALDVGGAI